MDELTEAGKRGNGETRRRQSRGRAVAQSRGIRSPHPGPRIPAPGSSYGERGSALATVLVLVVLLTVAGVVMVNSTLTETSIAYNQSDSAAAQYAAEAGLARAMYELSQNAGWSGTTAAIGDGQYVVAVTSSGSVRAITSTGTRGGGRRGFKAAGQAGAHSAPPPGPAETPATIGHGPARPARSTPSMPTASTCTSRAATPAGVTAAAHGPSMRHTPSNAGTTTSTASPARSGRASPIRYFLSNSTPAKRRAIRPAEAGEAGASRPTCPLSSAARAPVGTTEPAGGADPISAVREARISSPSADRAASSAAICWLPRSRFGVQTHRRRRDGPSSGAATAAAVAAGVPVRSHPLSPWPSIGRWLGHRNRQPIAAGRPPKKRRASSPPTITSIPALRSMCKMAQDIRAVSRPFRPPASRRPGRTPCWSPPSGLRTGLIPPLEHR